MGSCLNITLLSKEITLSKSAKNLGVTMDCNLTYDTHVTQLTSKCIRSLCQINRVKYLFDRRTLISIINSLVFSKLLYCSSVWAYTTKKNIELLQTVRHVGAHPGEHQHGVSIQVSISLGKTFLRISRIPNTPLT